MFLNWSLGGIVDLLMISWLIGGARNYILGYAVIAVIVLASMVLTAITKIPRKRHEVREGMLGDEAARTT